MIQKKQFAGGIFALGMVIAVQATSAATDASSTSWLMSETELAAHRATMATLEGPARDAYRNSQYEQLKQRALERGYKLPADPPWAATTSPDPIPAATPAAAAPEEDAAAQAAARHAAMREKLQARREALQKDSETKLERLQAAANAQQQQVEVQLQDLGKAPETAADVPAVPAESVAPVTPPAAEPKPAPAAPAPIAAAPPMPAAAPAAPPAPLTPPMPPAAPAYTDMKQVDSAPQFAPPEQPAPVIPPPQPDAVTANPPAKPAMVQQPYASSDAMAAYRESMRTRFDEYMKERQAQMEENAWRQRAQHEAAMEKNRSMRANRPGYAPYPYPAAPPSYGPRYPSAYPGYRSPYWQQQ